MIRDEVARHRTCQSSNLAETDAGLWLSENDLVAGLAWGSAHYGQKQTHGASQQSD